MQHRLAVTVNGEVKLEYDREKPLSPQQLEYLDSMDEKMAQGFEYNGEFITSPDQNQRAQFVTVNLIQALGGPWEAIDEPEVATIQQGADQ